MNPSKRRTLKCTQTTDLYKFKIFNRFFKINLVVLQNTFKN